MSLHDMPSAEALVESVREWLERDVMAGTTGRLQFHTRVAINVLSMVERELREGAAQEVEHCARLAQLGCADDAELAQRIRDGELDDRIADESRVNRQAVVVKHFANFLLIFIHFKSQQIAHLPVAILLDDIDILVLADELAN